MPLVRGSRLGPYEVVAPIGRGGMGEVYRARDTRLQRDVAIKVLPTGVTADDEGRRRFDQEARSIAAVSHPNICQIYDVGADYLVLEQAVALDPGFALARWDIAYTCMTLSVAGAMPTSEAVVRIRDEAKHALASEPRLSEAHAALALAAVFEYDWFAADASFRRALAVDSVSHDVRLLYAQWYLVPLGRFADALRQTEMALTEDPLNLFLRNSVGMIEICRGNEDRGVAAFRQLLDLNDRMFVPNLWLCGVALKHGRFGEALTRAERAYAIDSRNPMVIGTLAGALERSGDGDRAERLRGELGTGEANGAPAGLVFYHLVRGDADAAATWFERAIAQRDPCTSWIVGDLLTSSRHWPALAKAMNLPTS